MVNPILDNLKRGFDNEYIFALLVFIIFLFFAKILLVFSKNFLDKLTKKTKTKADDILLQKTEKLASYILILVGLKVAGSYINIPSEFLAQMNNIVNAVIIIIVMYVIMAFIDIMITLWGEKTKKKTDTPLIDELSHLFKTSMKIVVFLFTLFFVLNIWDIKLTAILTSLGIVGIIIGFAVKDSLANIFGGVSLIMDQPFLVNDLIKLDKGEIGIVQKIGMRSTNIKTLANEILNIPNGLLANMKVTNYAKPDKKVRITVEVSIMYGSKPEKVKKVLKAAAKNLNVIAKKPSPFVRFDKLGEFSMDFKLYAYIKDHRNMFEAKNLLTTRIYNDLKKNKIKIPYPTRTVHMKR